MLRRALVVIVASASLFACSSHAVIPSSPQGGGAFIPAILQSGGGEQWEQFLPPAGLQPAAIIAGPITSMWFAANGNIWNVGMSGAFTQMTTLAPGASIFGLVEGPDKNIWFTTDEFSQSEVYKMTPTGQLTLVSSINDGNGSYGAMCVGPDGNLWMTGTNSIERMTLDGTVTVIPLPKGVPELITSALDGGIWFTYNDGPLGIGRVDPTTLEVQQYDAPAGYGNLAGLVAGNDGNLWSGSVIGKLGRIVRITTGGVYTDYRPGIKSPVPIGVDVQGPSNLLYAVGVNNSGKYIVRFNESRLAADSSILFPDSGHKSVSGMALGPDGNLWMSDITYDAINVYVVRELTVSPTSVSESVGAQTTLTAAETKTPPTKLRAVSSNPNIAAVADGQTVGSFVVTGVASGSCSVRISDDRGNLVNVTITVN